MEDVLIIADGTRAEAKTRARDGLAALRRAYPQSAALIAALSDDMVRRIDAMPSDNVRCVARVDVRCQGGHDMPDVPDTPDALPGDDDDTEWIDEDTQ